jgi:hypothetical protein
MEVLMSQTSTMNASLSAAQTLVRTILGDNAATLTRSSCYKALEQHVERLSELERAMEKVETIKGRRDALSGPLKLLTLKLQTASKERHAAHKQAAKQEKEMERLRRQLKEAQEQNVALALAMANNKPIVSLEEIPAIAIACEELPVVQKEMEAEAEAENGNSSLNLLEDISESPEGPLVISEEPGEKQISIERKAFDESTLALSIVLKEKERKIEILEEYLMVESGMLKSPVNYWQVQLAFCATSILPEAMEKMDEALMQLRLQGAKVDIATWNNFMKFWACSGLPDAPEKMEGLVEYMRKECVDPEVRVRRNVVGEWLCVVGYR